MIYLVEDDPSIRKLVSYALKGAGYEVESFESGEEMMGKEGKEKPELYLLDIMLPGKSGLEILQDIRNDSSERDIPVIMLTAKGTEYDKVLGLDSGADDYIAKPFSIKEVNARIKALLNRTRHLAKDAGRTEPSKVWEDESLKVDYSRKDVLVDGLPVQLTRREFELFRLLFESPDRVYSREEILKTVWPEDGCVLDRTVDVHIKTLRQKLGEAGQLIETVRGMGYKIGGSEK